MTWYAQLGYGLGVLGLACFLMARRMLAAQDRAMAKLTTWVQGELDRVFAKLGKTLDEEALGEFRNRFERVLADIRKEGSLLPLRERLDRHSELFETQSSRITIQDETIEALERAADRRLDALEQKDRRLEGRDRDLLASSEKLRKAIHEDIDGFKRELKKITKEAGDRAQKQNGRISALQRVQKEMKDRLDAHGEVIDELIEEE